MYIIYVHNQQIIINRILKLEIDFYSYETQKAVSSVFPRLHANYYLIGGASSTIRNEVFGSSSSSSVFV